MGWPRFGKSDEKQPDGTQSKSEADALLDRFAALVDEKIKPVGEAVGKLQTKWDTIEAEAAKGAEPPPKNDSELTPEQITQRDKNNLLAISVATNARITESECISAMSGQWAHLAPSIREIFVRTPLQRKAQADYADYCNNVVDMTVGKAARSAGLRYDNSNGKFFIEDAAGKTGGDNSPLADPALSWQDPVSGRTEQASDTLRKLGIKPEEFVKSMKDGVV